MKTDKITREWSYLFFYINLLGVGEGICKKNKMILRKIV